MQRNETISVLKQLVHYSVDRESECADCARHARNTELQELFAGRARASREETAELEAIARELGVEPEHRGSLLGTAHRAWVTLRSSLSANCDGVLLEECERGEEVALMRYRGVLSSPLPEPVRCVVLKQYEHARDTCEQLRMLRARMPVVVN